MSTKVTNTFTNVGLLDAVIRAVSALALVGIVISLDLSPLASFLLAALSIPTMMFALMRWDPIYSLSGIATASDRLKA